MINDRCPCDRCNGRETGAWEDEAGTWPGYRDWEESIWEMYKDPYEGLCAACGEEIEKEDGSIHTMADCPSPWFWSAYEGNDREERIRIDLENN